MNEWMNEWINECMNVNDCEVELQRSLEMVFSVED